MNKDIDEKIDEIIKYIKESDSFKNYLKAKEILDKREDLKNNIAKIKQLQKEIIKRPSKNLKNELNELITNLNNDITYNEYNKYLIEVNNMLAILENRLNKYFNDVFN
ncbi:MAG: YlbF family regulator [Bacilli bacterium]|nr:YlbF family regulator [Bacilli bacterium]